MEFSFRGTYTSVCISPRTLARGMTYCIVICIPRRRRHQYCIYECSVPWLSLALVPHVAFQIHVRRDNVNTILCIK